MQNPRWDDIRLFLSLARARSLSRAGAELGLDASTMSRRLAGLETALGARLFDRTPEGLLATAAAEQVLPAAEEAERGMMRFANAAGGLETQAEGVVRVSAAPGVAADFLAPALPRLLGKHPRLRVELDATVRVVDLTRREADIALRSVRPTSPDLVMLKLATSRYAVLAAPAYAKKVGRVKDWSLLRWIGWGDDLAHIPAAAWLAQNAPGAAKLLATSSIAAQVTAAESGLGAVLLTEEYAPLKGLARVEAAPALAKKTEYPEETLWLVGHRALREVPRVAVVWAFVVEELARLRQRGTR
jgi:DNA-binding transcriptional LysR family regulator